jgi:hypothetical protein
VSLKVAIVNWSTVAFRSVCQKSELLASNCTNHLIKDPAFAVLLEVAYKNQEDYAVDKGYQWICTCGEELATRQSGI